MIENGTVLQDRYLIEKQIGAGGMGAVYLAVDQRFGSYVAIKETFYNSEEFGDAFEREARLLNTLHHPVLPHVSDYFTENNEHFLVMQYIEGEDLSEILKREGAFPVRDVLRWVMGLLDALDYLHSQEPPIIHRDIKPQNLKITPRGDIILLDFGLAKLKSEDTTGAKSVFGYSRKYSPLEQIQGTGTDARSDIFSLGATAYHLLTGKQPVDVLARASEIVIGNSDPLVLASEINNEVPQGIAKVLHSALALNPAARFVSANAMRQALEHAIVAGLPEEIESLPENPNFGVLPIEEPIVHSPEAEKFPALEAFVAETVKPELEPFQAQETGVIGLKEEAELVVESPRPELVEVEPQSTSVVEVPTKVIAASAGAQTKKSRFPLFAILAMLMGVGLAAGYFIKNAKTANNADENPVVQSTPETNAIIEQTSTIPNSEAIDEPVSTGPEPVDHAKTKPVSIEKTSPRIEKRESDDVPEIEVEPVVKPVAESPQREQKRSVPPVQTQSQRRSEPPRRNENQPRVVETQRPVNDIETIFTGQPVSVNERERRREERIREREQMSDEEWRETRRQRRQQRRQRPVGNTFPF